MRTIFNGAVIICSTALLGSAAIAVSLVPFAAGRCFFALARLWSRIITAWCGVKIDGELPPSGSIDWSRPFVCMSNHQSHYDIPSLFLTVPADLRFLTKKELSYIPIFGWALWAAGFVFIDRGRRDSAFESIRRAAADLVKKGRSIVIFPEGTRSSDGRLGPFKKGGFHLAIQARSPIVPAAVTGSMAVLGKHTMVVRPGRIRVRVGLPIDTSKYGAGETDRLMADVRAAIEALLAKG